MPRRVRIEDPGFYHIVNRGVEQRKVFMEPEDKDRFIEILCQQCEHGKANVHAYVLMDNHYHLLLETTEPNLSALMRQVNSRYAMYFNKKYARIGHLWQDRFKSWIVADERYFWTLLRYFELNPIKAGVAELFGQYYRSFLYDLIHGTLEPCMQASYFLQYPLQEVLQNLEVEFTKEDEENLAQIRRDNRGLVKKKLNLEKKPIEEFLSRTFRTKQERNAMIVQAYDAGYKQVEIANFFGVTPSLVSKIVRSAKERE